MKTRLESDLLDYESKYTENDVLKNKLDITDSNKLEEVERKITAIRLANLYMNPEIVKQTFDVKHYLGIHGYLFNGIYDFAGQIRREVIAKRTTFCLPQYIYNSLDATLADARRKARSLKTRESLIDYIATLYSDLNVIHPFREGNGRCGREFIRQYTDAVCQINNLEPFEFDYSAVDKQEFINAVIEANIGSDDSLKSMFTTMAKGRNR